VSVLRPYRLAFLAPFTVALILVASGAPLAGSATAELPTRLTDQEFWRLTVDLSEPNGVFGSDNLLSNELAFAHIVPSLVARTKPGGVYLGVGPEQNFTYIAAMRPRMAFITDIRRGNLHLQLMYKALFELSADRAEFVSRLFTKPRPNGLTSSSTATELMNAYWDVHTANEAAYVANLESIQKQLTRTRAVPLSPEDLDGIARVYRAFYWYGPRMNYLASTALTQPTSGPDALQLVNSMIGDYWGLMTQDDDTGRGLSYLASEDKFMFLKDLENRNLIVPVVGNFGGPKALRAVGAYVRTHGATISAFYVSNVEQYLRRDNAWSAFCANVATLPLNEASVFIRPSKGAAAIAIRNADGTVTTSYRAYAGGSGPAEGLVPIAGEVKSCTAAMR
jgi:hypothetical protein